MASCIHYTNNLNLVDENFLNNFEIKIIDLKKNRSLITKCSFKKGDVLFSERPIVSSQFAWNKFYNYSACEYCMKPLETAIENVRRLTENSSINLPYLKDCCEINKKSHCKCEQCGVDYCSEICRQQALSSYHYSLCSSSGQNQPTALLIDAWRQMHLPPETTTIELVVKLIAMIKQASDKSVLINKLLNFDCGLVNETEKIPHKLLGEKYFHELETLRELTVELFKNHLYVTECEPMLTKDGFRKLFSLIGRNSQGIGTSPFSVYVDNTSSLKGISKMDKKKLNKHIDKIYDTLDKTAGAFLNSEGSGLYEIQSMINHSCKPNAEITFKSNNFVLSIVALRDIEPNQEIFISYIDDCQLSRSRHSRQKILRENYLFNCECEICQSQLTTQADETSDEDLEEDDDEYEDIDDDDYDDDVEQEDKNNAAESMEN